MICYRVTDLKFLFETAHKSQLLKKIAERGYSFEELEEDFMRDRRKMKEIVDSMQLINDKEDTEIFQALYTFQKFYPEGLLCFYLRNSVNPKSISTLEELKNSLRENDINDFGILTDRELRNFQLKSYRGKDENLISFILNKLRHYGNDIGETNFLFVMQSGGGVVDGLFFEQIHNDLKSLKIRGTGHILIFYNEENKFAVINTVYPSLGTTRIPFEKILSH